jgi:hypothetical protein|tara:strand:+ start:13198 stop:14544 length:1347 start_codon:yes stop_codon:yes gene_type:complete
MITDFDKILNELSYRVKDGTPDLTNEQHLIKLFDVLKEYNWPINERVRLIKNLTTPSQIIVEGSTGATTFYHEVMTGILVAGGSSSFKDGAEVAKFFKNKKIKAVNSGLTEVPPAGAVWEKFLLKASIPKASLVSDASKLSSRIVKELGKGTNMMWTGPTNDGSKYGAADIAGTFSGYGDVGISLKAGVGQLKNLTLGTFTKALGLKELKGNDFITTYKSDFDAMTKDWVGLVTKLFNSKTKDSNAKKIFKRHIKNNWDSYQKEKISQEELDILTDATGISRIKQKESKHKKFTYFCRKMQQTFHPQWKAWNVKRTKHFKNIFETYLSGNENTIRLGLHNLFKKQLSVGETSLFYAAKGGDTFWFIPSEKLYNKKMGPEEFIADYELKESKSGYQFLLDVGTQSHGGIGTIIVTIRFADGQMESVPGVKSDYKLVSNDWSGLLGAFRK